MIQNEHTIFCEKYRPQTLKDFIGNSSLIDKIQQCITQNDIPHILFHGKAGTGKTSLAKIIAKETDCDYIYINASDTNSVDTMRDAVKEFASSVTFKTFKLIILDEADYLTPNAQAALRNIMETYSRVTRFILTCNYAERIIEPIQSRCQVFHVTSPSKKDIAIRLAHILKTESVEFELGDIATIVSLCHPDIRKCINYTQQQVIDGKLQLDKYSIAQNDYKFQVLEHLKVGSKKESFANIRQVIADYEVKDFTDLYKFLYDNVNDYGAGHIAKVILVIAEFQYSDSFSIDKEINAMAMMINILNEIK